MEAVTAKRNVLFEKVKRELETAKRVKSQEPSLCEVRERLERLQQLGNNFFDVQDEIEDSTPKATLQSLISVFDYRKEFEDRYYEAKSIYVELDEGSVASDVTDVQPANNIQSALAAPLQTQRALLSNQAAQAAQLNQLQQGSQLAAGQPYPAQPDPFIDVRLPPIEIPKFSGDRKAWRSFKDLYVSTIHSKETLQPSQKLKYLKSFLEGDASTHVSSFDISDANYPLAWEKLLKRYDQKKYTVYALVKEFLDQPIVSDANFADLQKLVTTSDEVIRQLDTLGEQYQTRDSWLIQLLLEKIDDETRALWAQKVVNMDNPTFPDFVKFLEDRCDALETCSSFSRQCTVDGDAAKKKMSKQPLKPAEKPIQSYVVTPQHCLKCYKAHNLFQCCEFKAISVADRLELVQKSKLCLNCLKPSHTVRSCSSKQFCKIDGCRQRHHTLLCQHDDSPVATAALQSQRQSTIPVQQPVTETQPPEDSSLKSDATGDPPAKTTVLPTALIKLRGKHGKFHTARAMIDSCSGASLISEACLARLGINRSNTRFPVTGVAGTQAGTTRGTTQLEIASRFNNDVILKTQAHVLEVLAPPTPCRSVNFKQTKLLEGLPLADPGFNQAGQVDVILGVELFLPMLQAGQIVDGDGLPVAQKSSLGWLVAGKLEEESMLQTQLTSLFVQLDVNVEPQGGTQSSGTLSTN
ncbi:uncharacterized protein LOC120432034 [Culex pipiens pallens]|uniref:uncharacterized protein LOC120432034 n=1 Tax=Culex pipiens pallens TaxID=42434 RepID=UPI001954830E|nr:uncharacterized protein LOC120432034 [Culex pipiens pallens]